MRSISIVAVAAGLRRLLLLASAACVGMTGCGYARAPDEAAADASATHIVYLHGRIVQEEGTQAVSPEYGAYAFDAIVDALAARGATVHAPVRRKGSELQASVDAVVALVRGLRAEGVAAQRITVVGASQGAVIAMLASGTLRDRELGFVLLGACSDEVADALPAPLYGRVFSVYEEGDPYGASCTTIARSDGVSAFAEKRLTTGLSHGFLYRPLPAWVEPSLDWAMTGHVMQADADAAR